MTLPDREKPAAEVTALRSRPKAPRPQTRRQLEEHYAALFALAPVGIARLSLDRRMEYVNDAFCEILGYSRKDLIGRRLREISHPEDNERTDTVVGELIASGASRTSLEKRFLRQNGSVVWTKLTMTVVREGDGPPSHRIVVIEDIDARVQAEKRLARVTALHLATNQINEAILHAASPEDLLRGACEILVKQGDFDVASVRMANDAKGVLELVATAGKEAKLVVARDSSTAPVSTDGPHLGARVFRGGKAIVTDDLQKDPTFATRMNNTRMAGYASSAAFPLKCAGSPIGVLMLASSSRHSIDKDLIVLFERVAENLSFALEKFAQEADHAKAVQALRESESRFRGLVNLSHDAYWEQDAQGRFLYNKETDTRAGMSIEPMTGKARWELNAAVALSCTWDEHRAVLAAHRPFRDFQFRHKMSDGTVHYISANGEPVFDAEGRFTGYRGTARNITAQKSNEEALLRFRTALDQSSDFILLSDARTLNILDLNDAVCEALGYRRDELIGRSIAVLVPGLRPDDTGAVPRRKSMDTPGQRDQMRSVWQCKDGTLLEVEILRQCIDTADGPVVVGIARDLADRLANERTIQRQVLRQECVARLGRLALDEKDPAELSRDAVRAAEKGLAIKEVVLFEFDEARRLMVRASGETLQAREGRDLPIPPALHERFASMLTTEIHHHGDHNPISQWMLDAWHGDFRSVLLCPVNVGESRMLVLAALSVDENAFSSEDAGFVEAIASLLSTALQRNESENRLAHLAQFDSLTGLANRTLLGDRLKQSIAQAIRQRWSGAVLFIDLDRFKQVNDTLGHASGDQLLAEAARRLQASVREGDSVARISGDEFAIILANLTHPEDAAVVAQKVLDALARPFQLGDREAAISGSVGIAVFPENGQDAGALLTLADSAMYSAKESGRNAFCFFSSEMNRTR
jgi:diguanylate cyclase (GGDEF)-like protein/PAS domain S-box-containing protein